MIFFFGYIWLQALVIPKLVLAGRLPAQQNATVSLLLFVNWCGGFIYLSKLFASLVPSPKFTTIFFRQMLLFLSDCDNIHCLWKIWHGTIIPFLIWPLSYGLLWYFPQAKLWKTIFHYLRRILSPTCFIVCKTEYYFLIDSFRGLQSRNLACDFHVTCSYENTHD